MVLQVKQDFKAMSKSPQLQCYFFISWCQEYRGLGVDNGSVKGGLLSVGDCFQFQV